MFSRIVSRIAALPLVTKVILGLIVFLLSAIFSPVMVLLAFLVLVIAAIILLFRVVRRRPLSIWGIVVLASLLLVIVYGGISAAMLRDSSQQASSPSEPKEEAKPTPPETPAATTEETTTTPETATQTATSKETPAQPEPVAEDAQGGAEPEREYDATVRVTRVVDGDTVDVSPAVDGKTRVRLIGVDTPETKEPGCEVQPYGPQASEFAESQLRGKDVGLEFDQDREDRNNRLLAYVYLPDGSMFNETLLEEGYAQVYTVPPNDKHANRFEEVQAGARAAGRGLWGLPADQLSQLDDRGNGIGSSGCVQKGQPKATPKQQPQPTPEPPPTPVGGGGTPPLPGGGCPDNAPIKGNRTSSTGDLIYHVRGGQFYEKTKAEECFASPSDAEAAGYRASKR